MLAYVVDRVIGCFGARKLRNARACAERAACRCETAGEERRNSCG